MRALRVLMMTLLTSALLCATAYGAGYVLIHQDDARDRASETPGATGATGATGQDNTSDFPAPQETEPATPLKLEFRLEPGDRGRTVRELQSRLFQLAWFPELTTGTYGGETREGVAGFQTKRSLKPTGVVDQQTWRRLTSMTKTPSPDQLFNVLHPGPALLGRGDTGEQVRDLQARLVTIAWLFGDVTGTYDAATAAAVRGFQEKREIPVTGEVDARTLERLHAMTYQPSYEQRHNITPEPGALDPRCKTGRALCIDKSTNSLRWVIDGKVQATYDVRFGSDELPTREGAFSVYRMSRDHVSSLYDTSMPFAMFFSGGQAVHYSPDFAATGYNGASHGCVNVRDYAGVAALFEQVRLGDTVIVYWS